MPTMPRTTAARLAPVTPNAMRATTGYGTPYLSDGGRSHRPVPTVWMRVMSAGKQPFRRKPRHSHERPRNFRRPALGGDAPVILYGWHSVTAALANPARRVRRLLATENALRRLGDEGIALKIEPELVRPDAIAARLTPDAVHQGLLLEADPLPSPAIEDFDADAGVVLVLDQITDPHNVGAILRTAAAFAVAAIVTTARHSPEATGVLAKSASGALEWVPIISVQNLARGLAALKERGFLVVGLDSEGTDDLAAMNLPAPLALVLGAEGKGLRQEHPRAMRSAGAARPAGRDQEPQRLQCGGAGALHRHARPGAGRQRRR